MAENANEQGPLLVKILVYVGGVVIGLAAKLATLNMEAKLTYKAIIFHTTVAFAAAWAVWMWLASYGKYDLAIISAVIIGRFGDSILLAIGKAVRQGLINLFKFDK
ncbi:hypothetical protein AAHN97_14945 [Chitinophaga niabensis]|uniref:hypothetical protein n=1 Tax=Chitinophaga niabensis TaxID=536979 RepID=UPI0031BA0C3C